MLSLMFWERSWRLQIQSAVSGYVNLLAQLHIINFRLFEMPKTVTQLVASLNLIAKLDSHKRKGHREL